MPRALQHTLQHAPQNTCPKHVLLNSMHLYTLGYCLLKSGPLTHDIRDADHQNEAPRAITIQQQLQQLQYKHRQQLQQERRQL